MYKHRDASVFPGTTQFTQLIKTYSAQINGYLQVTSDICAFGDASHESETIIGIIAELLEAHLKYIDDLDKTPLTERGDNIRPPSLDMPQYVHIKLMLDNLKGADATIEPPAFNFDLDVLEGGFED